MFDSAILEHKLDKEQFKKLATGLRDELIKAQLELSEHKSHTVLVLINGSDGAGKGEVLNRLYEWLDDHYVETLSYDVGEELDQSRPPFWQYWRDMPGHGRIGVVLGSWYHLAVSARAVGLIDKGDFSKSLDYIRAFEAMLTAERVRLVKLWLHLDPHEGRKRFEKAKEGNGFGRPLVVEWEQIDTAKERRRLATAAFEAVEASSPGYAPWVVIPAADSRYRDIAIAHEVLRVLNRCNAEANEKVGTVSAGVAAVLDPAPELPKPSILTTVDLTKTLEDKEYEEKLEVEQRKLFQLTSSKAFRQHGLVCAFEGSDAAGKGGCIRRLRQALDPREFRVHGITAPNDEERARPYLWRFWRHIPVKGRTVVFDRTWYGRVLVARVEGFWSEDDYKRANDEIKEFERQHSANGYVVVKFWLAISEEEQLRRFKAREEISFKQFKITDEDWRNRAKWPLYERAVTDMVDRTSTSYAPWNLVPCEDKRYGRVEVLKTVVRRLEEALG